MMQIKSAYYLRSMPTKIAVVLPDNSARVANLSPFRMIAPEELSPLAALENPQYRAQMLKTEIPDYILRFYGLEKLDAATQE